MYAKVDASQYRQSEMDTMFERILVANRGEIAARVIKTAQACGVYSIAVHSDVDANALHVDMADMAIPIGGASPADSYLRGPAIIKAALVSDAQAIHPGYGFLSENPEFAEAVDAAGLTFIGPSAKAIRAMGLKDRAKELMREAGVPVVPGSRGDSQEPDYLAGEAERVGYPVMIKAVAGGGGKGMRLVERGEDFLQALGSARSEALAAFGNGRVLVEKFIRKPRHIEIQVFGDGCHAIHLFERDCSLQRRHQKVIEEAPAPGMPAEMRKAMGAAAVRAAQAIEYKGAGTVEFIVDASDGLHLDGFWFMEMNTRLQVEHPVTEAIVGIDLVEWQLRVASGEPLPMEQDDLTMNGHAIEARIYAEDVPAGFLPATGRISHLSFPGNARIDTGVRTGDVVSPWYDPMIAKLTVHGAARGTALRRLEQALQRTELAGPATNMSFLRRLAALPEFVAGDVDTGLVARNLDSIAPAPVADNEVRAVAAIAALGLFEGIGELDGFHLWTAPEWTVTLTHLGDTFDAAVILHGAGRVTVQGPDFRLDLTNSGENWWRDERRIRARVHRNGNELTVFRGDGYRFMVNDPLDQEEDIGGSEDMISAPMPGLVRQMVAEPGKAVKSGERLAVLEAMKMEHGLLAPRDGTVAEVFCGNGSQVEAGHALILLHPEEC